MKVLHTGVGSGALDVKGSMKNSGRLKRSDSFHVKLNAMFLRIVPIRKFDVVMGYIFMLMGLGLTLKGIFSYGRHIEAHVVSVGIVAVNVCTGVFVLLMGYLMQRGKMPEKVSKAFFDEL